MDGEDGATVVTDTIKDDEDRTEPKSCPQQTVKVRKAETGHLLTIKTVKVRTKDTFLYIACSCYSDAQ